MAAPSGFVPPPYPYERLDALRRLAADRPGGIVDCSIGTPCDPVPEVVQRAVRSTVDGAMGYPASAGSPALREAAAVWIERRFGVTVAAEQVGACVGTKELVATLPHLLRMRDPGRDVVLYPAVAYPTYEMGAVLAGCRAVPVPLDARWQLDLTAVSDRDAARALVLWCNMPGNPTAAVTDDAGFAEIVAWARDRGVVVASDECYTELAPAPATALSAGTDGVLAVHSLSKRSNMAGLRVGFYTGDPDLVDYLVETRKHAGLMVPAPVQAGAVAALGDDEHVAVQRARYEARRALLLDGLGAAGLVHDGGPCAFYLWLRDARGAADGWDITARLAEAAGLLTSPGDLYGAGADHVRCALVQPCERLELALDRLVAARR